jgi:hypothetical protein
MADTLAIRRTLLATTDPVTIGDGIPLFPAIGMIDAGFSVGTNLWDTTIHASGFTIGTRAAITLEGGVLGPSYAGRMMVESGELDSVNDTLALQIVDDEYLAGMVIGVLGRLEFHVDIRSRWGHFVRHGWHVKWETYWKTWVNKTAGAEFDLIPLVITLTLLVASKVPALKKIVAFIPRGLLDGLHDRKAASDALMAGGGAVQLMPHMVGRLDLVQIGKVLAKTAPEVVQPEVAPVVEIASEVDDLSKEVRPIVKTGPIFGLDFPVDVTMRRLVAVGSDGTVARFGSLTFGPDVADVQGTLEAGDTLPGDVAEVGVEMTHATGLDLTVGWFVAVQWSKLFKKSKSKQERLLDTLGIDPTFLSTEYGYRYRNAEGATGDGGVTLTYLGEWDA